MSPDKGWTTHKGRHDGSITANLKRRFYRKNNKQTTHVLCKNDKFAMCSYSWYNTICLPFFYQRFEKVSDLRLCISDPYPSPIW